MTQPPLNILCDILAVPAPPVGYKSNYRLTYTKKKRGVASYWHLSPGWCYFSRPPAHQIHDANMSKPWTHQMKRSLKSPSDALPFYPYMSAKHFCNVSTQSYKICSLPWTRFRLGSTGPPMTQPPLNRLCDILAVSAPPMGYKSNYRLTYTKKKRGVASYWHQSPGWCYFSRPPAH